jgi:hypothetical protein
MRHTCIVPGLKSVNVSLPFGLHESSLWMIPVAIGAIAGLYSFFHGFSILQQQRPLPIRIPVKPPAHAAPKPVSETSEPPKRDPRTEVIQLSPNDSGELSSASLSQQGKIAAALLRAGVPSPATWSDEATHASVRVADPLPGEKPKDAASSEAEVSRVLQQGANAAAFRIPGLNPTASRNGSNREAMLMIWGGPILTLACVYLLASHLGWL